MNVIFKKYPFSALSTVVGLTLYLLGLLLNLELWERLVILITLGENYELDELIIPFFFLLLGFSLDALNTRKQNKHTLEKVYLYNQMNDQVMTEISQHLTKLLELRTALIKELPQAHDMRHELDRMIVKTFNHFENNKRRGDMNPTLMDIVIPSPISQSAAIFAGKLSQGKSKPQDL